MVLAKNCQEEQPPGKMVKYAQEPIAFDNEDLEGMT